VDKRIYSLVSSVYLGFKVQATDSTAYNHSFNITDSRKRSTTDDVDKRIYSLVSSVYLGFKVQARVQSLF
jgi:hypothetical protein